MFIDSAYHDVMDSSMLQHPSRGLYTTTSISNMSVHESRSYYVPIAVRPSSGDRPAGVVTMLASTSTGA
jgi:hypothetical protein